MIQARQLIAQYDKQPHEHRAMYLPTVNAMSRTVEKLLGKSKSTVNATSSNSNDFERNIVACYNCKQVGHKASACPRNHIKSEYEHNMYPQNDRITNRPYPGFSR